MTTMGDPLTEMRADRGRCAACPLTAEVTRLTAEVARLTAEAGGRDE